MPDYGGGGRHGMGGDRSGLGGQNRGGEGRQRQLEKQRELQRKDDIANLQRVAQQKPTPQPQRLHKDKFNNVKLTRPQLQERN